MINESHINWAIEQNACEDAIEWLRESPRSIADVIETYPDWLLEHASDRLTDPQFAAAIAGEPSAALAYEHACDRLTDDQFAVAIAAQPEIALFYEHASDRMTDAQFARAIAEKGTK